jgi:glycosyltransferase involved in cell wall biosynthesis
MAERLRDRLVSAGLAHWFAIADPWRIRRARGRRTGDAGAFVSVPIATFDRIPLLIERTLPALLTQTHAAIEIVVVGDGTPHALWAQLEQVADRRLRIRRLRRRTRYPKGGLERWMVAGWRPRRVAARLARGDWLLWMSDDDIILPDGVNALLEVARQSPDVEVITGSYRVGLEGGEVRRPDDARSGLGFDASGMPAMLIRRDLAGITWNRHSWRKRWNRPSDYDLMERLHQAGARYGWTPAIVAIVPEVAGTGLIGSLGSIEEERRRQDRD